MSLPLSYTVTGETAGPAIVFVHGFMGASPDWNPVVDALSDRFTCVTVDLPGHGASTGCDADRYTMAGAVRGVIDVLNDAGLAQAVLVGYSMGGRVALRAALQHPERVRRLVLESTSPGLRDAVDRRERRRRDAERAGQITQDLRGFLERWYRMSLFASLQHHNLVEEMVDRRAKNDPAEIARMIQALSPGRVRPVWDELGSLSTRTCLLTGDLDTKYAHITARAVDRLPDAERVVVSGAGHNVHAERPTAYLQVLAGFLDDL